MIELKGQLRQLRIILGGLYNGPPMRWTNDIFCTMQRVTFLRNVLHYTRVPQKDTEMYLTIEKKW